MNKMQQIARENERTDLPAFNVGDTLKIQYRIVDGNNSRLQAFQGSVIAIKNSGNSKTFTLRRVTAGQGVERTFPFNSPNLDSVSVERKGRVRRSKLYYLREKIGKSARIKEAN
ncbi:50S ribosomal protein L19 [Lentisphaera araneosa HTCC2155]|uniref:Large ribosomal subunit protein bL19 n=2 Tax=Lentisphaera TaxID=256846 RepID=A6DH17_9BACT|nr:50S ribosomal protein L19 [Lentisphaera araneosa HTCC2155]